MTKISSLSNNDLYSLMKISDMLVKHYCNLAEVHSGTPQSTESLTKANKCSNAQSKLFIEAEKRLEECVA